MKRFSIIIALIFFSFLTPHFVSAAPCPDFAITPPTDYPLPCLIVWFFIFVLTLSGVILFTLLLIAGFVYLTSLGSPERLRDARSRIKSALIGIILVLFSVTILYFINPELIDPELLKLEEVGIDKEEPLREAKLSKYFFFGNHNCDEEPQRCCPPLTRDTVIIDRDEKARQKTKRERKTTWTMCTKEQMGDLRIRVNDRVIHHRAIFGDGTGWVNGGQKHCKGWEVVEAEKANQAGTTFNSRGELTKFHRFTCNRALQVWCCSEVTVTETTVTYPSP